MVNEELSDEGLSDVVNLVMKGSAVKGYLSD